MRVPTFRAGSQDNTSLLVLCSPLNEAFSRLAPVCFAFSRNNGLPEAAVGLTGCAHANRAFVLFKDEYWWSWRQRQLDGTATWLSQRNRIWIRTEDFRPLLRCYSLHGQNDGALRLKACYSVVMLARGTEWEQKIAVINGNGSYFSVRLCRKIS